MTKRILLPLGDDPAHEAVVPIVRALARDSGGSVRLLRVYPVPRQVVTESGRVVTYLDQEMDRVTASGVDDLRRVEAQLDVPAESVVRFGDPAEEIALEAEAVDADLVVLSTAPRGRLRGLLAPGIAAEVARTSPAPTLVLRR